MGIHHIKAIQNIPVTLDQAWEFFSNPKNLSLITPPHLSLRFTNEIYGEKMYPGQIITYYVRPVLNLPIFWMTEITQVENLKFFIDEQRQGPYSIWHHQHHFKSIAGGVEMTDIIHYKIPLWVLGDLVNQLYVRKKLQSIFEYRFEKVAGIFGSWGDSKMQIWFS